MSPLTPKCNFKVLTPCRNIVTMCPLRCGGSETGYDGDKHCTTSSITQMRFDSSRSPTGGIPASS